MGESILLVKFPEPVQYPIREPIPEPASELEPTPQPTPEPIADARLMILRTYTRANRRLSRHRSRRLSRVCSRCLSFEVAVRSLVSPRRIDPLNHHDRVPQVLPNKKSQSRFVSDNVTLLVKTKSVFLIKMLQRDSIVLVKTKSVLLIKMLRGRQISALSRL